MTDIDDLTKLRRHQDVLRELAHLATEQRPLEMLLNNFAVQVARAVEIQHVKILRYRPEYGDLLMAAGIGWQDGFVGHATFSIDLSSPGGSAFQTGQPVCVASLSQSGEFRISPLLEAHDIVSLANVPIQIDGAAWGVLEVDSEVPRDFSIDTQTFLLTAASILGAALRHMHAYGASEKRLGEQAVAAQRRDLQLVEVYHRVKNNFQGILSLIAHEQRKLGKDQQQCLKSVADGIIAMSLAHDQLALSQTKETVNLSNYLETLATRVQKPIPNLVVEVNAEDYDTTIDMAVPIGLILNELITNCVKHAFDETGGTVKVGLVRARLPGELKMIVSDNGRGIDATRPGGSGMKLINALARQVRGRVERESSDKGTRTTIYFPAR
jgi:two-component sensor histidine kinase